MAFSLTGTGVAITKGRGAAKVVLEVSFKDLEAWAKKMQVNTPRLMNRSFGRACSGLKKKFRQVIVQAGGVCGVPKFRDFEEFTKELRAINGTSSRPMGGVLAEQKRIVAFKRNGYQVIGWPDTLMKLAVNFQEGAGGWGERLFTEPALRHMLHKKGIRHVPHSYAHNPRRVIPEPFGGYVDANLTQWAKGVYYKELAREMQKSSGGGR